MGNNDYFIMARSYCRRVFVCVVTILLGVSCILVCCSTKGNDDVFNGEIRYVDDSGVITKNVESNPVPLDEGYMGMGMIAVYDSLLVCWNTEFPDHFFDVFNVDTGEKLGSFCGKGRGHEESISVGCVYQFFKKGDDIMTLLYASNEGKLFFLEYKSIFGERHDSIRYDRPV